MFVTSDTTAFSVITDVPLIVTFIVLGVSGLSLIYFRVKYNKILTNLRLRVNDDFENGGKNENSQYPAGKREA